MTSAAARITADHKECLDALVVVPENARQSPMDRLRSGPVLRCCKACPNLRGRSIASKKFEDSPKVCHTLTNCQRHESLPSRGLRNAAKAKAVSRMPDERTLLAFIRALEASTQDDVLDLLDVIVTKIWANAAQKDRTGHAVARVGRSRCRRSDFARPSARLQSCNNVVRFMPLSALDLAVTYGFRPNPISARWLFVEAPHPQDEQVDRHQRPVSDWPPFVIKLIVTPGLRIYVGVAEVARNRTTPQTGGRLFSREWRAGITPRAHSGPSPAFPVSRFLERKGSWQRSSLTCRAAERATRAAMLSHSVKDCGR